MHLLKIYRFSFLTFRCPCHFILTGTFIDLIVFRAKAFILSKVNQVSSKKNISVFSVYHSSQLSFRLNTSVFFSLFSCKKLFFFFSEK